jgi:hypothetical protein
MVHISSVGDVVGAALAGIQAGRAVAEQDRLSLDECNRLVDSCVSECVTLRGEQWSQQGRAAFVASATTYLHDHGYTLDHFMTAQSWIIRRPYKRNLIITDFFPTRDELAMVGETFVTVEAMHAAVRKAEMQAYRRGRADEHRTASQDVAAARGAAATIALLELTIKELEASLENLRHEIAALRSGQDTPSDPDVEVNAAPTEAAPVIDQDTAGGTTV